MDKQTHILFTATFSTPFIREDLSFLQEYYTVTSVIRSGPVTFFRWFPALFNADVTFSWFASVYSSLLVLIAKLLRKRSIIIIGGVDVARMPEFNYGLWNSRWKSIIVRYGLKNADIVLAVDESLKQDAIRLVCYDGKNIRVVPTGYNSEQWTPGRTQDRTILTVAHCDTVSRAMIKGIDFLAATARLMPEVQFRLIGITQQVAAHFDLPPNIVHQPPVDQSQLLEYYRSAAVFFQPSRREGLPNTLCEAMLCGCIPVGTNIGGIPTAIGDTGTVVPFGDTAKAKEALLNSLDRKDQSASRERIAVHFSQRQRQEQLLSAIRTLTNGK